MQQETIELVKAQRDGLKLKLAEQNRRATGPTATGLALIGLALLIFWYLTSNSSLMSIVIFLAGVTLLSSAVLLYFMTPARYLRSEVSDGVALGNTLNVQRLLSGMLIEGQGIHLPVSRAGGPKVFIPVSDGGRLPLEAFKAGSIFIVPADGAARGLLLEPPGCGLVRQACQIGAGFSDSGLEGELKDVLEKGLELARTVEVKRAGGEVRVSLAGMASAGMCEFIRREHPGLCTRIGCPICSFIACAIVDGTGRPARIKSIAAEDQALTVTFEVLKGA